MAPEHTYRREVGYATDVFGLGVLFYRFLSGGTLPFQGPLPHYEGDEKRQLDYGVAPRLPWEINPEVPPVLGAVAMRAIEPDMGARYQAPQEFEAALREAAEATVGVWEPPDDDEDDDGSYADGGDDYIEDDDDGNGDGDR